MKLSDIRHPISIMGIVGCLLVCLCSCALAKPLQLFNRQSKEEVFSLAFSADGNVLAICSSAPTTLPGTNANNPRLPEGTIEFWDLKTGNSSCRAVERSYS